MDKIILSSTHIDAHRTRITLSALQGMAQQINGSTKVRWGLEHDMSLPPLGRIDNAEVIKGEDGEYYLHAALIPYDNSFLLELSDGTFLRKEAFDLPVVFVENIASDCDNVVISLDPVNVGDNDSLTNLYQDIRQESNLSFDERGLFRKSLIPDPEVVIQIANHYVDFLFIYKLLEKPIEKLQEKLIEDFYDLIKVTAKNASKRLLPFDKPITYIFKGNYNGVIFELLTQTRIAELLMESINPEKLQGIVALINSYKLILGAVKVQFIYEVSKSAWELNYMIDTEGSVVGNNKCFDRQKAVFKTIMLNNRIDS